jgi:YVTN family beta-propeller protein
LGDPQPGNFSPLYFGQVLVHGMGSSPDNRTLAVVSIASNSVSFIDTATNKVKHVSYVGRSPHEASIGIGTNGGLTAIKASASSDSEDMSSIL